MKYILICILIISLCPYQSYSQNKKHSISGHVYVDNIVRENIEVIIEELDTRAFTDAKGRYTINNLSSGTYVLYALHQDGYVEVKSVDLKASTDTLDFHIKTSTIELKEVTINASRKIDELRLNPIKAEVIDVTHFHEKATNIQNLLNASPGVRLRNTGALGASNEVIINGFSGRSIKLMRDGIPLDYLGSSFGITKIPVNSVERMEVYKGVLPTEIGIDALGGAINLVSRKLYDSEIQVSFERGSFNTNIATINGFRRLNRNISVGLYAFGNYSDNDYKVKNLPYYEEETGRNTYIEARLFHNKFKQYFVEGYVNFDNLSWADLLQFRVTSFALHQDMQNDFTTRDRAFGAVYRTEKAIAIPSVTYRKSFIDSRLNTTHFLVYSKIDNLFVDTLKNTYYDWKGVAHSSTSASEIGSVYTSAPGKNGLESDYQNMIYRGLLSYHITPSHILTANVVDNYFINKKDDEVNPLEKKRITYNRLIVGVGYNAGLFDNKLNTIVQMKSLFYQTKGKESVYSSSELVNEDRSISKQGLSFSLAVKYNILNNLLIRASYENTYRLPDQMEIFGDNTFIISNLDLSPEKSNNFNLGLKLHKPAKYNFEINTYFRNTTDLIRLKEINQYQGLFLNLEKVKGYGIELDGYYTFFDKLRLTGNLTYNEFRYNGSLDENANDVHFKDARISNTPFYYGNLGVEYTINNVLGKNNILRTYWNYSYVHQYYLDYIEKQYEPDGFLGLFGKSKISTDRVIPQQQLHTAGTSFDMKTYKESRLTLGFEVRNIFDKDIYNNFKMQNPGRSFWAKAVYLFK